MEIPTANPGDGWQEWGKHVLTELERHSGGLEKVDDSLSEIKVEIGKLQVKSGLWGAVAGGFVTAVMYVAALLKK